MLTENIFGYVYYIYNSFLRFIYNKAGPDSAITIIRQTKYMHSFDSKDFQKCYF